MFGLNSLPFPRNLSLSPTEFLREEVVVLLTAQFITLFNQTALEVSQPAVPGPSAGLPERFPLLLRSEFNPGCINLSLTWKVALR